MRPKVIPKVADTSNFRSKQFSLFFICKSPWYFLLSFGSIFKSIGLSFYLNRFLRWPPWWPSWISDRNILAFFFFFLICTSPWYFLLDTSYWVSSRFVFRFWRRSSKWRPSSISDQNDFSFLLSASHPDTSDQVSGQWAFRFRSRSSKYILKMTAMAAILNFRSERF